MQLRGPKTGREVQQPPPEPISVSQHPEGPVTPTWVSFKSIQSLVRFASAAGVNAGVPFQVLGVWMLLFPAKDCYNFQDFPSDTMFHGRREARLLQRWLFRPSAGEGGWDEFGLDLLEANPQPNATGH